MPRMQRYFTLPSRLSPSPRVLTSVPHSLARAALPLLHHRPAPALIPTHPLTHKHTPSRTCPRTRPAPTHFRTCRRLAGPDSPALCRVPQPEGDGRVSEGQGRRRRSQDLGARPTSDADPPQPPSSPAAFPCALGAPPLLPFPILTLQTHMRVAAGPAVSLLQIASHDPPPPPSVRLICIPSLHHPLPSNS